MRKRTKNRTNHSVFLVTVFILSFISMASIAQIEMNGNIAGGSGYDLAPELSTISHFSYSVIESILFSF
ncbi:MAG: hypothetical protein V3V00_02555 [Saprospiraceae bacterium]